RRLALAAAVTALFWALGPHWLRYLLPGLPVLALALATGAPEGPGLARAALLTCLLAGLPANLGPLLTQSVDTLPAATGHEDRQTFLARHYPPAASIAWANRHLPADAVVALMFDWSTYLLHRPVLLASVEDHIPTRVFLLTRGDQALVDLQAAGATHLIVTRARFIEKLYPFLSEEELAETMNGPVALLDELLLTQATLIHQDGATRIYRLDGP
ncbi:MAG: hypothetical protein GXP62_12935, partial [Oligoflexia bacterium]|nr:hypothetical protein [Oligoflexia bacterium]